jgi:sulfate transport system permease protein
MAATTTPILKPASNAEQENGSSLARWLLTTIALLFLGVMVVVPVVSVFSQALAKGATAYVQVFFPSNAPPPPNLTRLERRQFARQAEESAKTWSSIRMTIGVAICAVPVNVIFGLAASWVIAKFKFKGRSLLIALIDLPFSVSPVVAGLIFMLLFAQGGWFGNWASNFNWAFPAPFWRGFTDNWWPIGVAIERYTGIIWTPLATVIATLFITFPFVARNLIPLMEEQGNDEELAAATLGAGGWAIFRRVTLPNIKWGLLYGIILCNARAMGEFGAVSVVGGDQDATRTIPLRVERLYQDANITAAFAVASILTLLAVVTLVFKSLLEWKQRRDLAAAAA